MRSHAAETESVGTDSVASPGPRQLPAGSVIAGRYEIGPILGSGGYAVVYLAFDRELGREVALKALRSDRNSPAALARFRREVSVAHEIASPYLVRIHDIGTDGDLCYLTMEVVRGESLRERLRAAPLDVDDALAIATGILRGLEVLHQSGVVHRDVKPENVLLDEHGVPKLADFGLARVVDDAAHATITGAVIGTTDYVSPEQALGRCVDARSDLFSLGVVLFEMLTGRLPVEKESSLGSVLARLHERAPNIRSLRGDVPLWLAGVVARLLSKEPSQRYASAAEVLEAIERRRIDLRRFVTRTIAAAAGIAVVVAAGFFLRPVHETQLRFHRLADVKGGIAAVGTKGEILWRRDGVNTYPAVRYALARIARGKPPVLATIFLRPGDFSPASRQTLRFLDPDTGAEIRKVELPTGVEPFKDDPDRRDSPDRFQVSALNAVDFDGDGIDEIVVNYQHVPEAPSYAVLYEPLLDRSRVVFIGRGGYLFLGAYDVDGDGRRDFIVGGINNGYDWFNALGAIRLQPPIGQSSGASQDIETIYSPDLPYMTNENLLWHVLLPRGAEAYDPAQLRWDSARRLMTVGYTNRSPVMVTFDGFLTTDRSAVSVEQRQQFRRQAYEHEREKRRLLGAGFTVEAEREAREAVTDAEKAGDALLIECMQRSLGRTLIFIGRIAEGEALMNRLAATSENTSEVAYEAGQAFHFRGDIDRAVAWYKRGFGRGAPMGIGKSKHEFIQAIVFALGERGEWARAREEVDAFDRAYGDNIAPRYREFITWRSGGTPNLIDLGPWPTDLTHYWALEFRNANHENPATLLALVQGEIDERCEPVAPLWSLKAELLARLGRTSEAAAAAQRAWDIGKVDATRNLIARGHLSLIRERLHRYGSISAGSQHA